jgi:hypothetical protein
LDRLRADLSLPIKIRSAPPEIATNAAAFGVARLADATPGDSKTRNGFANAPNLAITLRDSRRRSVSLYIAAHGAPRSPQP